jgi:hypothetical protein
MKFFKSNGDKKLKAARASRDGVRDRLSAAETEIERLGADAERLAIAGDDAALELVEQKRHAMRARKETLVLALVRAEQTLREHEEEVARVADKKARIETANEIEALKVELLARAASFQSASRGLETICSRLALFLFDAVPLQRFAAGAAMEVGPAADMLADVAEGHKRAVLAGTAAARLPKEEATSAPMPNNAVSEVAAERLQPHEQQNVEPLPPEAAAEWHGETIIGMATVTERTY